MTSLECARCQTVLEGRILACPVCSSLLFADQLKALAASAQQSAASGNITGALGSWREALELVPSGTDQHEYIAGQIAELGRKLEEAAHQKPAWAKAMGPVGGVLALLLTKGKLLLVGLSKLPTLGSMLVSFGAYAYEFGWQYGLGLVLSIYVHEIGHVYAARRYGMKASVPMFIPFIGAFITLQQRPVAPRENAVISLAGPLWGAVGAALTFAAWWITDSQSLLAIAETAAVMNLFNLMAVPPLDGSGAFRALNRPFRIVAAAVIIVLWAATRKHILALVAAGAVWQCFRREQAAEADRRTLFEYSALAAVLAGMIWLAPAPHLSEAVPEPQLNDSRLAGRGDASKQRVDPRRVGVAQVGAVEQVEELGAELQLVPFELRHREVLER